MSQSENVCIICNERADWLQQVDLRTRDGTEKSLEAAFCRECGDAVDANNWASLTPIEEVGSTTAVETEPADRATED